jgi:2-methylcitrate dehydratase PrpD
MMRCIDHPTMLKDGSGWGSMAGISAAQLAAKGFTGAPAVTVEDEPLNSLWSDLGDRWRMCELYFKRYACCRWAQPAIDGALNLKEQHQINPYEIKKVVVHTFKEATHLTISRPANTEQAQYSLPYPVAAALLSGQLDPPQVMPPSIFDEETLNLADSISIKTDESFQERFPDEALARVTLELSDGRKFESSVHSAPGDPKAPMSDMEIIEKFNRIAGAYLPDQRLIALREACWNLEKLESIKQLVGLLSPPLEKNHYGKT